MYINKLLANNEKVLLRLKFHWFKYISPVFFIVFAIVFAVYPEEGNEVMAEMLKWGSLLCLFFAVYYWIKIITREMVITNHRVISKKGAIAVGIEELRNVKIETINLKQTILGRIFGYGDIEITGTGISSIKLEFIGNPTQRISQIKKIIDKAKELS